jgi:hypothetical protein
MQIHLHFLHRFVLILQKSYSPYNIHALSEKRSGRGRVGLNRGTVPAVSRRSCELPRMISATTVRHTHGVSGLRTTSCILRAKNTMLRTLDLFPSSGERDEAMWFLRSLRKSYFRLMAETDSVTEALCFLILEYRTMGKVQQPITSSVIHHRQNTSMLW